MIKLKNFAMKWYELSTFQLTQMNNLVWLLAFLPFLSQTQSLKNAIAGKINGPKHFDSRIAVVGGGPAGIHMAYLLKQEGFTNVVVLEQSGRIGGKSKSVQYRGSRHEMGTVYLNADYEENVIELVNKFVPGDLLPFPIASVLRETENGTTILHYPHFMMTHLLNYYQTTNVTLASLKCVKALDKYVAIHKRLFNEYEHELMPEPTDEVSTCIACHLNLFLFTELNSSTLMSKILEQKYTLALVHL